MTAEGPVPMLSARACSQDVAHPDLDPAGTGGARKAAVAVRRRRFRLLRYLGGGLLALMLAFAPAAPARANLLDCVEAAVPVTQGLELGQLGAEVAACASLITSDPVAAAVMATLVALAAHGDIPPVTDQCNAAIDGIIAKALAEALLAILSNQLDDDQKQLLTKVINSAASLSDVIDAIPILQPLMQYLHCGCTILGAPGAAAKIADEYMKNAAGCGQFFEDIGKDMLKALGYVVCGFTFGIICPEDSCEQAPGFDPANAEARYWFCYAHWHDSDACASTCSDWQGDRNCRGILCDAGQQCGGGTFYGSSNLHDQCVPCPTGFNKFYTDLQGNWHFKGVGVVRDDGSCGCSDGYQPVYKETAGGKILENCTCDWPYREFNGYCACPTGQERKNEVCTPCRDDQLYSDDALGCHDCGVAGMKADPSHTKCVPACDASKGEYAFYKESLAHKNLECRQCDGGANVVYSNPAMQGGLGHCEPKCLPGRVLQPAQTPGPTIMAPVTCNACPENYRAVYDNPDSSFGKCEACPDYTASNAGSIQCTPLDCGNTGYIDPDNKHACKFCPAGQIYYPEKITPVPGATEIDKKVVKGPGYCGCPPDTKQVGDTCECPAFALKHCWAPGSCTCTGCPEGAHLDQATFACKCPAGTELDPTGTKCQCLGGGKCLSPLPLQPGVVKGPAEEQAPPLSTKAERGAVSPKNCSALGPAFINNPRNAAQCIRCSDGRVANETRTACVAKPGPARKGTGVIVGPRIKSPGDTLLTPQPKRTPARISCPYGMKPNAKGTACVPQVSQPKVRAPVPVPQGSGQGSPGGRVPSPTPQ